MTVGAWHRSETGQTTALVAAMLFTLAMFVALVVNVGQLVNRRVALQVVADAGAWSGATVQAAQLNHYAFWSRMVQTAYRTASAVSLRFNFGECVSSVAAAGLYAYAQTGMARAQANFANTAYSEAQRHSLFNIDDLFPGERSNFDFSTTAGLSDGSVFAPFNGNIFTVPLSRGDRLYVGNHAWSRETPGQLAIELAYRFTRFIPLAVTRAGSGSENWQCVNILPPTSFRVYLLPPAVPGVIGPGYKLQRLGQPYLFVWKVSERRPTRAYFFDRFFGPNAVPPMTAVAVAKAVGGDVHRGQSRYRAKMVPVSRYSLTGGVINDPDARPGRILRGSFRQIAH